MRDTVGCQSFSTGVLGNNYAARLTARLEKSCRVPGFVHSPLLPDTVKGTISHELFHVTDWLPTIVGL